jgi:DNA-binding CsgD family transcriptional regulator
MIDSSPPGTSSDLIGRETEIQRVDDVLDRLRIGGAALVIRGEPGIGKSALLHRARKRAGELGADVLMTVGVESEAEFAFAGLQHLVDPIGSLTTLLPDPQRRALESAFGIADELEPDPFRVALATYRLVSEAAESNPLVLIVDDAQWIDQASTAVLSFVARRLESEPVALVAAVREGYTTPLDETDLPTIRLERLSPSAAGALLDRNAPSLHPVNRARLLAEAAGNPLALVELPLAENTHASLGPGPTSLTARLERAFAARLDDLSEETRLVLLAAALDGRASLEEMLAGAALIHGSPVKVSALDAAAEAALVDVVETGLLFRHPLIRSAVEQAARPGLVLAMYSALADTVADPERRLWHRAMAAVGCDEEIARALEDHALVARRRGAVAVAAAALERAATLTADPHIKGERLVLAAELTYDLGLVDVTRRLLARAEPLEIESLAAARLAWLQHVISGDVWVETGAAKTFVAIAEQILDAGDPDMALRSLVPIAHRCWWTRPQTRTRQYLVDTAERVGVRDDDPRLLAVVALAHPEVTGPSVLSRLARRRPHELSDPIASMYVGIAAEKAGDPVVGAPFLARAVERLREQGRLGMLTQALVHYAWVATHTGDWGGAAAAAMEGARLARDTRQPEFGLTGELIAALVAALRGNDPDFEMMIATPERALRALKAGPMLAPAHLARGAAAIGEGRNADAFRHLWPVLDENSPAFHRFMRWPAVLDIVEAGAPAEHRERLAGAIGDLDAIAVRSKPPALSVWLSCARPLMASDEDAEALFVEALGQDLAGYPFPRARTLFSFGRWLRRHRRSADSREPLRGAIQLFDALGATRWSERARNELRATGESIGRRTPQARDRLTAQELQIAQLAAQGLSNREIGERLFLSHRTVGGHLYRMFPKLGITARAQLRDALAANTVDL